jgi:cell division protein FtsL
MAAAAATIRSADFIGERAGERSAAERRPFWTGTPEIYFSKAIDNSRLVKVEDPQRNREMRQFATALVVLFVLVFGYTWQHFRAIEYGYQIESSKRDLTSLTEMNHALRLEDASLRDPERIDLLARRMGLVPPQPGQVIRMDSVSADAQGPVMASAAPVTVIAGN